MGNRLKGGLKMSIKCIGCGSTEIVPVFDLGNQPFANALIKDVKVSEKRYPLVLNYCKRCSLAQLSYIADPKELFSNYVWVTASSTSAQEYSEVFCTRALKHLHNKNTGYVLEVASNDGTFLKPFKKNGFEVLGIDPAANIVQRANQKGIPTKEAFFSEETAEDVVTEKGYPILIFARNVLPHVQNLHGFIKGLRRCCGDNTLLAIEIHYSGKILDELHYDSIYHEHICYFTLHSVQNVLEQHGLYIFDIDFSPISGGSIVLYLQIKEKERSTALQEFIHLEETAGYNTLERWKTFGQTAKQHKQMLNGLINTAIAQGKKIIGYGASARSSTMLNYCGIDVSKISVIADQNELKQGLFTPGTHIPIVSPASAMSESPDIVLILAWNFTEEIVSILRNQFDFHGEIILPLPYPPRRENI